jgi:hypothetical protein
MRNSDYYRAVLLGAVLGMSFLALFYMINVAVDVKDPEPAKVESNTKVVDTYKGCDIVQWHYNPLSEYKYFLHCDNK